MKYYVWIGTTKNKKTLTNGELPDATQQQ